MDPICNRRKISRRHGARRAQTRSVCEDRLAIFSPNGGIFSPAAPPNQKNGPSSRVSRIEKYPEDTSRGPVKQFDMCSHLGPPRSSKARLELYVTGQPSEFQRQIISSAVDFGPQNLEIADVLAPKSAQQLAKEHVLDEVFARWSPHNVRDPAAGSASVQVFAPSACLPNAIRFPWRGSPLEVGRMQQQS
jgi:hypothetical protein